MIPLEMTRWGYLTVDRDAWIEDRTSGEHAEATDAFAAYCLLRTGDTSYDLRTSARVYQSELLLDWLRALGAKGIYGDGDPVQSCSYNEDNFLSDDIIMTFAHTDDFGPLFCWQHGIYTDSTVNILQFAGDDDSEAFDWAHAYADCDNPECDPEWIIEDTLTLWPNGGSGPTYRVDDVTFPRIDAEGTEHPDEPITMCPKCCAGELRFLAR